MDAEAFVTVLQQEGIWGHYSAGIQQIIRDQAAGLDNNPPTAEAFKAVLSVLWNFNTPVHERVIDLFTQRPRPEDGNVLRDVLQLVNDRVGPTTDLTGAVLDLWEHWTSFHTRPPSDTRRYAPVAASGFDDSMPRRLLALLESAAFFYDVGGTRPLAHQLTLIRMFAFVDSSGQETIAHMMSPHGRGTGRWRYLPPMMTNNRRRPVMFDLDLLTREPTLTHVARYLDLAPSVAFSPSAPVPLAGSEATRSAVLRQLLEELDEPDVYINQANRGTCAMTSISHRLAVFNPSEYARIASELFLAVPGVASGTARLQDSTVVTPPTDAWPPETVPSGRSWSEVLIQSGLMNLWGQGTYVNSRPPVAGITASGQSNDGFSGTVSIPRIAVVATSVFGHRYTWVDQNPVDELLRRIGREPVLIGSLWGVGVAGQQPPAHMFDADYASQSFYPDQRGVIGRVAGVPDPRRMEGPQMRDLLIFWNPWGGITPQMAAVNQTPGNLGQTRTLNPATPTQPTLRVVSGRAGYLGMPQAEVRQFVYGVCVLA